MHIWINLIQNKFDSLADIIKDNIDILMIPSKYDNFILPSDFNSCMEDSPMKIFGEIYKLWDLIKEPTCFKNPDNPTSIDLILANKPLNFKNTYVIKTSLFDSGQNDGVMKMHFPKMKPQALLVIGNIRNFITKLS